jgi:hypothetical protein
MKRDTKCIQVEGYEEDTMKNNLSDQKSGSILQK